jgi:hypothetical protein
MVEEVCLREMNLYGSLAPPDPKEALELKATLSATGLFGTLLQNNSETLPIG